MDILKPNYPEELPLLDIGEYKGRIAKADGTLVPLAKKSTQGNQLFIASRYIVNPRLEDSPDAEKLFYGWEEDRKGIGAFSGVVTIDVYAKEGDEIVPVGHMDWWLQGDYANGGGNMHAAIVPRNEVEQRAQDRWGGRYGNDHVAFKIEEEYRKQQIGSLMLATSSVVLPNADITRFYTGALLEPAEATYARFDVHKDDFPRIRHTGEEKWWQRDLPIDRLVNNPRVDQVIQHFIEQPVQEAAID